ncbi:hypothetical protein, conserved, partial [Eimeria tenella]
VLESAASDNDETEAAAACISHLLRVWSCSSSSSAAAAAAADGPRSLLQIAVQHSIGPLQQLLSAAAVTSNGDTAAAAAAAAADTETLTHVVAAVAATCRAAVPLLLQQTHADGALQQLLETLAAAVALPRTLGLLLQQQHHSHPQQQQQQQHYSEAAAGDYEAAAFLSVKAVRFFCDLRYDIEDAEQQQQQQQQEQQVNAQSKQALLQVYRHLSEEALQQIEIPSAQISQRMLEEFYSFRDQLLLLLEDCAALIGLELPMRVTSRMQQLLQSHQLQQQQQQQLSAAAAEDVFERPLECLFVALDYTFPYTSAGSTAAAVLTSAVAAVQAVLKPSLPQVGSSSSSSSSNRRSSSSKSSSSSSDGRSLQAAVGLLASQLSLPGAAAAAAGGGAGAAGELLRHRAAAAAAAVELLRHRAAAALEDVCRNAKHPVDTQTIHHLAALADSLSAEPVAEKAYWLVLEAVCSLVGRLKEDHLMLSMLESLCRPSIAAIEETLAAGQQQQQQQNICTKLDALAIVLRDTSSGVKQEPQCLAAVQAFVCSTLWPLLQQLLLQQQQNAAAVERALRCMKHAVRTAGDAFKPLVLPFLQVLQTNAQVCVHPTYLYATEWMAVCFGFEGPQVQQQLAALIQQLATAGFEAIQKQAVLEDSADMVEDCYGMLSRLLKRCPPVAAAVPSALRQGLENCSLCMAVDTQEAAKLVFVFMESIVHAAKETSEPQLQAAAAQLASEFLPLLVRSAFELLGRAPSALKAQLIEDFIVVVVSELGAEASPWLAGKAAKRPQRRFCGHRGNPPKVPAGRNEAQGLNEQQQQQQQQQQKQQQNKPRHEQKQQQKQRPLQQLLQQQLLQRQLQQLLQQQQQQQLVVQYICLEVERKHFYNSFPLLELSKTERQKKCFCCNACSPELSYYSLLSFFL